MKRRHFALLKLNDSLGKIMQTQENYLWTIDDSHQIQNFCSLVAVMCVPESSFLKSVKVVYQTHLLSHSKSTIINCL